MRYVVCTSDDRGHFVVVDADDARAAASAGVEEIMAEWGDEFRCRDCEGPNFFEIHVHAAAQTTVWTIGHDVVEKVDRDE